MSQRYLDRQNCSVNNEENGDYGYDRDENTHLLAGSNSSRFKKKNDEERDLVSETEVRIVDGRRFSKPSAGGDGKQEYAVVTLEDLEPKKQSSLVTIFSIWSTMMGTSTLAIPWAIEKSGFACGIVLLVVMAALCLYTAHLIVRSRSYVVIPGCRDVDFTDVCRSYLGRWGAWLSIFTSLLSLLCATVVYWILMSNFLYNSVDFVYDKITDKFNSTHPLSNQTDYDDVVCILPHVNQNRTNGIVSLASPSSHWPLLSNPAPRAPGADDLYGKIWNLGLTVPIVLIAFVFPLLNFKSPTFFTKTSALGSISLLFLVSFVLRKALKWGIHLNFEPTDILPEVPLFRWSFPTMSGMLSLAYFIHNAIISILKNNRRQENNGRDLSIAFVCVMATLTFIGTTFFITFPLDKNCLSDNLLNNLVPGDNWAFSVRLVLLLQLMLVFPMLAYILRVQLLKEAFGSIYPSLLHVVVFNVIVVVLCVLMAIFFPHIGNIIRYCGSICGFSYIFTLPSLVHLLRSREKGDLRPMSVLGHGSLVVLGAVNCVAQFVI